MRLLILLLCLTAAPVAAQDIVAFPEPTRQANQDVCTSAPPIRVCRHASENGGRVVMSRDGEETVRWSASSPGIFDDLRVFRLSNDRYLVAVLDAVSNGLGVATWTLAVTDGERVVYRFVARDFDPEGGSFGMELRHPSGRRSQPVIWATEWQASDDPSGRRGPGYYLIGRPFYFSADGLVPAAHLPIRARRLLYSFRRGPGGPVAWLSDRRAESRRRDPFWSGRPSGTPGVIASIDLTRATVVVRAGDQDMEVSLESWIGGAGTGRFGALASGRLFPPEYVPASAEGRTVRVGTGPEGSVILWLD